MLVFEWGSWTFEPQEWRLTSVRDGVVSLPKRTLQLLALLLDRAPRLVSKDDILSGVWGDTVVEEGNIAFHVALLRKTLDREGAGPSCIETVRGRGYRFTATLSRRGAGSERADELAPPALPAAGSPVETPRADVEEAVLMPAGPTFSAPAWRRHMAHMWPVLPVTAAVLLVSKLAFPAEVTVREAARVAGGLGRHLGLGARSRTPTAEALTLTLRGRELWRLRTPPSVQQAISFYERAIDVAPDFAPAYAGLADCYNLTMSGLPVEVRAVNAKTNAERALSLDSNLAEAHTSLAFALYKFEWRWQDAEGAFRRAIAIDPSYALAHHWYGEMLALTGRFDEAIVELRQALALDPQSLPIIADLAGALLRSGRTAEARAVVEDGAAVDPMFHGVVGRMAEVLAAEGRERESLEEEWRALVLRGAPLESVEELRAAYRAGGLPAVLRVEIARLESRATERFAVPARASFIASKYARLRDRALALHWIAIAIDRREDIALHLPTYPEYDWLRSDPEFTRQLARVGLPSSASPTR